MPPIYAVVSFFSYRFFRSYTYYSLAEVAYEECQAHSCPLDATLITAPRLSLSAHSCLYFATICVSNYSCDLDFGSLLLIEYVAATAVGHSAENAIQRKDKRKLPIPVRTVSFTVSAQIDVSFSFASFVAGDIAQQKYVATVYPMLSI